MALALRFHSPYLSAYSQDPLPLVLQSIGYAKESVDLCLHHLNLEPLVAQAAAIRDLGVKVRWIIDLTESSGHVEKETEALLSRYRFEKGRDWRAFKGGSTVMHQKYVVVDRRRVFTGTMSFTQEGFYLQDNVDLFVDSPQVAEAFTRATEIYWNETQAQSQGSSQWPESITPVEDVVVGPDQRVSAYFTPYDGHIVIEKLVEAISLAENTIQFALPAIADPRVSSALEERAAKGIRIHGLVDQSLSVPEHWKFTPALRQAIHEKHIRGMGNFLREGHRARDLMHASLVVVDERYVYTASCNLLHSGKQHAANRTADGGMFIDSKPLAKQAVEFIDALRTLAMAGGHTAETYRHQGAFAVPGGQVARTPTRRKTAATPTKTVTALKKAATKTTAAKKRSAIAAQKPAPKRTTKVAKRTIGKAKRAGRTGARAA